MKLYFAFVHLHFYIVYIFYFLGLFSIIFGTVISLYQVNIKRFIGYSGIGHIGYIFLVLGTHPSLSLSLVGAVYFLIIYVVILLGFFCILVEYDLQAIKKNIDLITIFDFVKIARHNLFTSTFACFNLLSLAGVPIFAGFFAKVFIFSALVDISDFVVACIVILFSVLSCVYYIRILRFIYFDET